MNATTERPEATPVYDPSKPAVDVLPLRNGHRLAITWLASTTDTTPQSGFLTVDAPEGSTTYSVTESPCSIGRCFVLAKVATDNPPKRGQNTRAEWYCVETGPAADGRGDRCECRSWQTRFTCRHVDAMRTLIINGWV